MLVKKSFWQGAEDRVEFPPWLHYGDKIFPPNTFLNRWRYSSTKQTEACSITAVIQTAGVLRKRIWSGWLRLERCLVSPMRTLSGG